MRLLQRLSNGYIALTRNFHDVATPQYAILSHTWGNQEEEVTFDDMSGSRGRDKAVVRQEEEKEDNRFYYYGAT